MSSRIIPAEDLGDFEPVALGALPPQAHSPLRAGAMPRPESAADDALREAFHLGHRKGLETGRAEATQTYARQRALEHERLGATLEQRVEAIVNGFAVEWHAFHQLGAERLIDLAIEIARQTVRDQIRTDRSALLPVVREALSQLHDESLPTVLFVHPADEAMVTEHLGRLAAQRRIELRVDAEVGVGGCRLVNPAAEVDARLAERWRRSLAAMGRPDPIGEAEPFAELPTADGVTLATGSSQAAGAVDVTDPAAPAASHP